MLKIDKQQTLHGVTVYGDDTRDDTFYLLPPGPSFRLVDGKPSFQFIKYRKLRKSGDDLFGGMVAFDTELTVDADTLAKVTADLQAQVDAATARRALLRGPSGGTPAQRPVRIAPITFTDGSVDLLIGEGDAFVQKVRGAGMPSNYGANVASFRIELTQEGAALFEQAMQGDGGFVQVVYKLKHWAKLPPIRASARWSASRLYAFSQVVSIDDPVCGESSYSESVRETMKSNEVMDIRFDFISAPDASAEDVAKTEKTIRDTITRQLEEAVERNMLDVIQKENPDVKSLRDEGGFEEIRRSVSKRAFSDVSIGWTENQVVKWSIAPQGMLPNITAMKGPDGKGFAWADYAREVDLDDAYFRTIDVNLRVNADFDDLPIFNVVATLEYPHGSAAKTESFTFSKPDDLARFRTFREGDKAKYRFSYKVNYEGASKAYVAPAIETADTELTINVDDLGVLMVDIAPGDINFELIPRAQLVLRYEDAGIAPFERQVTLTADSANHRIREVLFQPRTRPIRYQVRYFYADGREKLGPWIEQMGQQVYVNDLIKAKRTIGVRAIGDLQARIASISVDLEYIDAANDDAQATSVVLSKSSPFFDWEIATATETGGTIRWRERVTFADGTSKAKDWQQASGNTVFVGELVEAKLEVMVVPDLLDFSALKLVNVSLRYRDRGHDVDLRKDLLFKPGDEAKTWTVPLEDDAARDYTWSARFFLADGSRRELVDQPSTGDTLILELPA